VTYRILKREMSPKPAVGLGSLCATRSRLKRMENKDTVPLFEPIRAAAFKVLRPRAPSLDRAEAALVRGRKDVAAQMFRALAEGGSMQAQLRVAHLYEHGEGVLQNAVEAVSWLQRAAEQGSAPASSRLGAIYLTGLAAANEAMPAALQLGAFTSQQDPSQEWLLKHVYPYGLAVAQDVEKAAIWNSRAAEAGDAAAQVRLGHQYAAGLGVKQNLGAAERCFDEAVNQSYAAAFLGLGMLHAGAYGGPHDHSRALEWLEPCAESGNSTAQFCLALLLLFGDEIAHDHERAATLLASAADAGQPAAMFHLGELYRRGCGVAQSAAEAEAWLCRAATRGHLKALVSLVQLIRARPEPDLNEAVRLCRQAAEFGDAEAQYLLGQFYLSGQGVARDPNEAARWLGKAADQNVTAAIERIGALHAAMPDEFRAAADWYLRADALGEANALYHLGTLRLGGLGLPRDPLAARKWYGAAAAAGSGPACLQLGILHSRGELVRKDSRAAARWYAEAAANGEAAGSYHLAFLFFRGLGVARHPGRGLRLLEQAAEGGSVQAAWALYTQYLGEQYVPADPEQATRWLWRAAELGSAAAACLLAQGVEQGELAASAATVAKLLESCAAHGDADVQTRLGLWYHEGRHVTPSQRLAMRWLNRGALGGNACAQAWLGDVFMHGRGVIVKDWDAALHWYERAALKGNAEAIAALCSIGGNGDSDDADTRAFQFWLKAAEQGNPGAQYAVGDCYLRGVGTAPSTEQARRWLGAAALQGHSPATALLGDVLARTAAGASTRNAIEAALFADSTAAVPVLQHAVVDARSIPVLRISESVS
jgi:TPR repeat protein